MTTAHTPPINPALRQQLRAALDRHFNLDELKRLCFDLGIDHEQFGAKKPEFIRDLLLHGEKHDLTAQIIAHARNLRPNLGIGPSGGVFNAPRLEKQVFGRASDIDALVTRLTGPASAVSAHNALSAEGSGGVGKTTLALALAHDRRVREHFAEGVLWTSLGTQNDLSSALDHYAAALGFDVSAISDTEARADAIAQAIGPRRMLLIVDDAWESAAALTLRHCAGPHCACLLTTRDGGIAKQFAPALGAVRKVPPLAQTDAFDLLKALAPEVCAVAPTRRANWPSRSAGCRWRLNCWAATWPNPSTTSLPSCAPRASGV